MLAKHVCHTRTSFLHGYAKKVSEECLGPPTLPDHGFELPFWDTIDDYRLERIC
jgi:hypothetical protein